MICDEKLSRTETEKIIKNLLIQYVTDQRLFVNYFH